MSLPDLLSYSQRGRKNRDEKDSFVYNAPYTSAKCWQQWIGTGVKACPQKFIGCRLVSLINLLERIEDSLTTGTSLAVILSLDPVPSSIYI